VRDIDNHRKAIYDALVHSRIIEDDSHIAQDWAAKMETMPGGRCLVVIQSLDWMDNWAKAVWDAALSNSADIRTDDENKYGRLDEMQRAIEASPERPPMDTFPWDRRKPKKKGAA
jgi:hypothetical protein